MTVAYQPEYARLPDADGKPVGVSAGVFLSQAVYWSGRVADAGGWFEWSAEQCEEQTGLTRREQDTIRKRLTEAGLIARDRKGVKGRMHYRVCLPLLHQTVQQEPAEAIARNRASEPTQLHQTVQLISTDAPNGATDAEQLHEIVQLNAPNGATEPGDVSFQSNLDSNPESLPPISPQEPAVKAKRTLPNALDEHAKRLLAAFRSARYPGEPPMTQSDWQAYRTNLRALAEDGRTPDQVRTATENALERWERGMVNPRSVARHITGLLEPVVRGSPPVRTAGKTQREMSLLDRAEEIAAAFRET